MFYFFKTPVILQKILPNYLWRKHTNKKVVYLTFDDGPTPIITTSVLKTLKKFNVKATFFCLGKNVENHVDIVDRILKEGHAIGNHTYSHLNGWDTKYKIYLDDIERADKSFLSSIKSLKEVKLFRPAYGKITLKQAKELRKKDYTIVLWDVLSGDFDTKLSPEKSLRKVVKHTKSGSIVVFHDSIKAQKTLEFVLPKALEYWKENGYDFLAL